MNSSSTFISTLVLVGLLGIVVLLMVDHEKINTDHLEQRRKECLGKGGQFGVIDGGRGTFCLEPTT